MSKEAPVNIKMKQMLRSQATVKPSQAPVTM